MSLHIILIDGKSLKLKLFAGIPHAVSILHNSQSLGGIGKNGNLKYK